MGSSTGASGRGQSKSPKQSNNSAPPIRDAHSDAKQSDAVHNPDPSSNADPAKPLAPPPRPGQQQGPTGNTPDYFNGNVSANGGSLSLEPNPFEQSFSGGGAPETPGGTKLPSVAALTSPSSLLPGTGVTPFAWGGGSLRTGPLSPAMLSAPTTDYFSDTHHIRGGFPTPNESSLRTGLTPGGSGSMFPAASPNTQAMFGQLTGSGATPGTIDFHRAAINAAAAKREQQQQALAQAPPSVTSQPQELSTAVAPATVKIETNKPASGPFDPHDNDAANGLFMLAQGRSTQPPNPPYTMAPQQQVHAHPMAPVSVAAPTITAAPIHASPVMKGNTSSRASGSARGMSEVGSIGSDDSEPPRPNTRGKGKRNSTSTATTNGRRKAEEAPGKAPASKKAKTNGASISMHDMEELSDDDDDDDMGGDDMGPKGKMTDEEKRKNFLERNRVAALKCRQRKKQWLANLQQKVETYGSENDHLLGQISQLREEVVNLKTLLLAHKDCPVTQQQGLHGAFMQQTMDAFNPQMNPYGMAAAIPNQAVMAGQPVNRRFS